MSALALALLPPQLPPPPCDICLRHRPQPMSCSPLPHSCREVAAALRRPAFLPSQLRLWPLAFQAAVRTLLLALHRLNRRLEARGAAAAGAPAAAAAQGPFQEGARRGIVQHMAAGWVWPAAA